TYTALVSQVSYFWSISGNSAASINGSTTSKCVKVDVAANPADFSKFTLTLITSNANGCTTTCTKKVGIQSHSAGCALEGPLAACANSVNLYTNTIAPGSNPSYAWSIIGDNTGGADFVPPGTPSTNASGVYVKEGPNGGTNLVRVVITYNG